MTLLEIIKPRLGVYYSEENKDREIQGMINGAINYFKGAGWNFSSLLSSLSEKNIELEGFKETLELLEEIEEPDSEILDEIAITKDEIKDLKLEIADILTDLSLPIEAITLYCKMASPTSAFQLTNHPVLTSMIAQGRSGGNEI